MNDSKCSVSENNALLYSVITAQATHIAVDLQVLSAGKIDIINYNNNTI